MATEFDNLQMGPCYANFKTTDLGLTKGGVEVEFSTEVSNITADQFGETILDQVINGRAIKVKVPMAESDITKLAVAFPGVTLVENGTDKKLVVNAAVGTSLRSLAGPLVLHPKDRDVADKSRDLVVPFAMAKGDMSFAFKSDEQRVYMLEFEGYADLDSDELFTFGDPAVVAL